MQRIGPSDQGQVGGAGTQTPVEGMRSADPHSGAEGPGGAKRKP
jgi:hypothetical protein